VSLQRALGFPPPKAAAELFEKKMNPYRRSAAVVFTGVTLGLALPMDAQTTQRVATGLSNPIYVTAPPSDPTRLFIAEQGVGGTASIKILNLATNTVNPTPFLTISGLASGSEQGLLGLAFDPNYATNGKFYVNVTATGGTFSQGITQIRQYTVSANPNVSGTAFNTVFSLNQPQSNHNGGWIGFSPRPGDTNNLYIALGDGGGGNDQGTGHFEPGGNAQNPNVLLGKILRLQINPSNGTYTNPATNPFGNEVFALGLRNPFRASFDRLTGDLYMGDVGQGAREEIDRQLASNPNGGENYGWRLREGTIQTPGSVGGPRPAGNVEPILDYDRTVGTTVTGGYVYRGSATALDGKYLFADFGNGRLFMTNPDGSGGRQEITSLLDPAGSQSISNPSSFGEDALGEVYIVDYSDGEVYRIIPEPGTSILLGLGGLLGVTARRRRSMH
jgi:glucose/arabinose dehydrogenase